MRVTKENAPLYKIIRKNFVDMTSELRSNVETEAELQITEERKIMIESRCKHQNSKGHKGPQSRSERSPVLYVNYT